MSAAAEQEGGRARLRSAGRAGRGGGQPQAAAPSGRSRGAPRAGGQGSALRAAPARPEPSQVLLTLARSTEGRVAMAVAQTQNPKRRSGPRKPARGGIRRVRPGREDLASPGTSKMVSFSGVFAPIIRRNNSNLKIVLFSVLSSF